MSLARRSGGALRDASGDPVVPQFVLDRLASCDARLLAQYSASLGTFAVYLRWAEGDSRYVMIQEQQIGDFPYDMLCALPTDVPLDEMGAWVEGQLRRVAGTREDVRQMIDAEHARTTAANAAIVDEKAAQIVEDVLTASTKAISIGTRRTKVRSIT